MTAVPWLSATRHVFLVHNAEIDARGGLNLGVACLGPSIRPTTAFLFVLVSVMHFADVSVHACWCLVCALQLF